ncbi:MAG: hypothetical protein KDN05_20645 [Verrucomicrobiae bacterium]|nr:hypothetical protein [Verrucomicrobiae bacterium]
MAVYEIQATVIMNDGRILSGWYPVGTLSEGGYDFEVDLDDYDLHRRKVLMIPLDIQETDAHPSRGPEYRVLRREASESEGQRADSYHLMPPDEIPGSDSDTSPEATDPNARADGGPVE